MSDPQFARLTDQILSFLFFILIFFNKKNSNLKIWNLKKEKKTENWQLLVKEKKICIHFILGFVPSLWVAIRAIKPWSDRAKQIYFKLQSEPPSLWAEIQAIKLRYKPSRVEPHFLAIILLPNSKVSLKLHIEFEGKC